MLARIGGVWTELGVSEPYWSVLSAEHFKLDAFEPNREGFYKSAERDFEVVKAFVARAAKHLPKNGRCFEFGCGVGRVTVVLARYFREVVAYDISKTHLELAKTAIREAGADNVKFSSATNGATLDRHGYFDFVFSVIALQHNPPPVIAFAIRELCGILNPGGLAYLQVPTYQARYSFSAQRYLSQQSNGIEMHALPQSVIFKIFEEKNCRLLEVREDDWVGLPDFISNTFLIERASA